MSNTVFKYSEMDIKSLEALKTIRAALSPRELSYIEKIVFIYTWQGKLYREMSQETGYEQGYLKDIGSQLWLSLSQRLGQQVTKKNLKLILENFCADKSLVTTRYSQPDITSSKIELPGSPLPFGSSLYIERSPIENLAIASLNQAGSLIRIKAPQGMGKTSLINHVMGVARNLGIQTVFVDVQQADTEVLGDLDRFLRWFCWNIGQQLNLEPKFDDYWFESAGSKLSCTTYVQEYLLHQVQQPILVAIDKVHCLVEYPNLAKNFFPLLRSWYEQARVREDWQKLRLMIAHSAELELPIQSNQSPFNVGLPLYLPELTTEQVKDLANRYELNKVGISNFATLDPLLKLLGGHPYLLQLAFSWLRLGYLSLTQLLETASTANGIYGEHLHRLWWILQRNDHLMQGFSKVLSATTPIHLDNTTAYQLEGMGLVKFQGLKVSLRCELYREYFCTHLECGHD